MGVFQIQFHAKHEVAHSKKESKYKEIFQYFLLTFLSMAIFE